MPEAPMSRHIAEAKSSDIVVYPGRHEMISWLVLSAFCTLASAMLTITPILLIIFIPDVRAQGGQGGAIAVAMMMAVFFLASAWMACLMFSLAFSGEPVLVINREGIRVGKIYGFADIVLPWEEVRSVYGVSLSLSTLLIQPVDNELFFARLGPIMRLTCRLSMLSGAPIALYQSFLDQPIEAILEQIQTHYRKELQLHNRIHQAKDHTSSASGKRDITLYTSRWHLLAAAFFLVIALFPGFILVSVGPWQLSGVLMSLLFLLGGTSTGSILAWNILRVPVLVVDDEGIASPRLLKQAKIKWEEIDAIYCGPGEKDMLIDASPSGIVAFLARRNKGQLVIPHSMDITLPQTVYTIPERMLPLPSASLLEQIKARFQNKLEYYNIGIAVY